jgi:proteasome subunit B (beta)-like protein
MNGKFLRKQIIFAVLLLPTVSLGTSIVAIRVPRYVVIAADSKVTYRGELGPPTVCKIFQSGPLYFAIAGLEHDRERNFYPKTIIANSFSKTVFAASVENVKQAMKDALRAELMRMKVEDPDSYRDTLKDGGDVLSILLVEVQNDVPYITGMGFQFTYSPEPQVSVSQLSCPGDDCPKGTLALYLGRQDAARQFVHANLSIGPDPAQYAKHLVELEIQESPKDVGMPISVLFIDQSGHPHWQANEVGCPVLVPVETKTRQ